MQGLDTRAKSRWLIHLLTVRSVPIQLHLSFLLLIAWVITQDPHTPLLSILFVIAVFFCVLLHECGHVFTGQVFNIRTRDITLYPFGGIATLLSQPTPPQELFIAAAGPLVNVAIGVFLYSLLLAGFAETSPALYGFLADLLWANIYLAVFNLIPALPMDGGRILRSLLALLRVGHATRIAARISQVLSVGLCLLGVFSGSVILLIIGVLVFLGAMQELVTDKARAVVVGKTVKDLMTEASKLYVLHHGDRLSAAITIALRTPQQYLPVLYRDSLVGIVEREYLIAQTITEEDEQYVGSLMERDYLSLSPNTPLEEAIPAMAQRGTDVAVVFQDTMFAGLLFQSPLAELMLIDSVRKKITEASPPESRRDDF